MINMTVRTFRSAIRLWKDESGASALEYGLIVALIGLVVAGGATTLGTNIDTFLSNIASTVSTVSTSISGGGAGAGGAG
jgi:pilus assembly protein Flp/PilA